MAAITEMIIKQLPAMCEAIARPISAIDKVSIIDSGNGDSDEISEKISKEVGTYQIEHIR